MSLWHIRTVSPCMEYIELGRACYTTTPPLWGPDGLIYNGHLITCPRHYKQTTNDVANFFYEPGNDRLIAHLLLNTTYWPGWDARRYEFDAETGKWLNRDSVLNRSSDSWIGIWGAAWTRDATMGSFNKIYACRNSETAIREISWRSAEPVEGGWWVDPYTWNPKSIYSFAVVNRVDGLLAAASSWTLDCWRNIGTTPERFAQLRLPNVLNYLAYESRRNCWGITRDGIIVKADYQIPRWEMTSQVQNPAADARGYYITYDTKRKQAVVFRWLPDAADGACRSQLEFYYPVVKATLLTQPVPVTSLKAGERVMLVSHLVGDAGEGVTPYTVEGELLPPAEGYLATPVSGTEFNGRACFIYQAPWQTCTETLKVSANIEEP
uniref:Uncharacterized protein n=1 Tax=Desulfobacca acetoxidans TaxID=60893 RepID=A0A7C3Z0V1_9BACT